MYIVPDVFLRTLIDAVVAVEQSFRPDIHSVLVGVDGGTRLDVFMHFAMNGVGLDDPANALYLYPQASLMRWSMYHVVFCGLSSSLASCKDDMPFLDTHILYMIHSHSTIGILDDSMIVPMRAENWEWQSRHR